MNRSERFVVFECKYSPDFGREAVKALKIFSDVEKAEEYEAEIQLKKWKELLEKDKSNWKHGQDYARHFEKLVSLGYKESGMSEEELKTLISKIKEEDELMSFRMAIIIPVSEISDFEDIQNSSGFEILEKLEIGIFLAERKRKEEQDAMVAKMQDFLRKRK